MAATATSSGKEVRSCDQQQRLRQQAFKELETLLTNAVREGVHGTVAIEVSVVNGVPQLIRSRTDKTIK